MVADAFAGAEEAVDQDKMAPLTAVAQFGRNGLMHSLRRMRSSA